MADAPAPFFIVGAPRSGTTMLRLMLNEHPDICVPPESHFVIDLPRVLGSHFDPHRAWTALLEHDRFKEWKLDEDDLRTRIDRADPTWHGFFSAVFECAAARDGKSRWGDKTPVYARDLPRLHAIFPEAHIIHIVRDGRDVATSLQSMEWFSDDIIDCARRWAETVRMADADGRAFFGDRYHLVRYETLVTEAEPILTVLCAQMGFPYDDAMLRFHENAEKHIDDHRRAWHARTSERVSADAVGRYRHALSARDVAIVECIGHDLLKQFDYDCPPRPSLSARCALLFRRTLEELRLHRPETYRTTTPNAGARS